MSEGGDPKGTAASHNQNTNNERGKFGIIHNANLNCRFCNCGGCRRDGFIVWESTVILFLSELNKLQPEYYFLTNKKPNLKTYLEKYFDNITE